MLLLGPLLLGATPAIATGCAFEPQGEGRVAAVIDARTFRLDDGREVRLIGIEPAVPDKTKATAALSAIIAGRDVTLHLRRDLGVVDVKLGFAVGPVAVVLQERGGELAEGAARHY